MRGVDALRAFVALGAATNSRVWRNPFAEILSSESPAHPWRASVRRTLKSHRSD